MKVITVEPAEDVTGGPLKAFVDRRSLAGVFRGTPEGQVGTKLLQDFNGLIGASCIKNGKFKIRVVLTKHAVDRLHDEVTLVVRRRDHGNFRRVKRHGVME